MKHEVSSQANINSEILIRSILNAFCDPQVLKFISIASNLRNKEANKWCMYAGYVAKKVRMGNECIKVNDNMKCMSEI